MRGRAVGALAAVWIEAEAQAATGERDFRAVLDALPIPVWLRDRTLALLWGNRAFLAATGAADLDAMTRRKRRSKKPSAIWPAPRAPKATC